jgi:uncharacterized protein YidB (DUF937 family)
MDPQVDYLEKALNSPFVIGAAGAFVTMLKFMPGATLTEKGINLLCGTLISGYLAEPLTSIFGLEKKLYLGGASFLLGVLGIAVLTALFQALREAGLAAILRSWLVKPGTPKE